MGAWETKKGIPLFKELAEKLRAMKTLLEEAIAREKEKLEEYENNDG